MDLGMILMADATALISAAAGAAFGCALSARRTAEIATNRATEITCKSVLLVLSELQASLVYFKLAIEKTKEAQADLAEASRLMCEFYRIALEARVELSTTPMSETSRPKANVSHET